MAWTYAHEGKPQPKGGDLSLVTAWDKRPLCVIETTSVEVVLFNKVSEDFARTEGEDDQTLESWKGNHTQFFAGECARIGRNPHEGMLIVCERFPGGLSTRARAERGVTLDVGARASAGPAVAPPERRLFDLRPRSLHHIRHALVVHGQQLAKVAIAHRPWLNALHVQAIEDHRVFLQFVHGGVDAGCFGRGCGCASRPLVYLGMTGLDPDVRFDKHKAGIQANIYVQKWGVRLLPALYTMYNPMPHEGARDMEVELEIALRELGYGVWQA